VRQITAHSPCTFLQTTQEKLPEAARLFDLSEHRLDDRFALGIDARSHLGLQFPAHAVHPCRSLGKRPPRTRLLATTVGFPVGRDEACDLFLLQILQIRINRRLHHLRSMSLTQSSVTYNRLLHNVRVQHAFLL
jgi:hypothetical protein